jgi:hypothetical protein
MQLVVQVLVIPVLTTELQQLAVQVFKHLEQLILAAVAAVVVVEILVALAAQELLLFDTP